MSDRRLFLAFAASLAGLPLAGCATAPPPVPRYAPNFTYAYPPGEAPASDVTIAIVRPINVNASQAMSASMLTVQDDNVRKMDDDFRAGIVAQLQELLNRKGFKQTGPFDDLNSMTFPDKKAADLTLTVQVGLSFIGPSERIRDTGIVATIGPCSASGFISFVMLEPLSGEKIWIKKADFPQTEVDCTGKGGMDSLRIVVENGRAQLLEKVFQLAMKKAWDYISPEEIMLLKKQSQELRAKKVY